MISVVGNLTGDDAQHASGQLQSANGKAQQKLNDPNPSVPNVCRHSLSAQSESTNLSHLHCQATTFDASNPSKANAQTNTLLGSESLVSFSLALFAYRGACVIDQALKKQSARLWASVLIFELEC